MPRQNRFIIGRLHLYLYSFRPDPVGVVDRIDDGRGRPAGLAGSALLDDDDDAP